MANIAAPFWIPVCDDNFWAVIQVSLSHNGAVTITLFFYANDHYHDPLMRHLYLSSIQLIPSKYQIL